MGNLRQQLVNKIWYICRFESPPCDCSSLYVEMLSSYEQSFKRNDFRQKVSFTQCMHSQTNIGHPKKLPPLFITGLFDLTEKALTAIIMARSANILLIGGGAVGTMVAYALETGDLARVTMVLRSNYNKVRESGFSIDSIDHGRDITRWRPTTVLNTIPNVFNEALTPFDYIVVTTKNVPDVSPSVAELVAPALTPGITAIVLMQNGLNIEKPLQARFPDTTILSGVQLIGAEEKSPGVILHNEPDICKLGAFHAERQDEQRKARDEENARRFIQLYNACGKVDCQFDDNVRYTRWRKLLYNSSYNSVSAVLGLDVTRMRIWEHIIDDLIKPIMQEIIAIAAADGIVLSQDLIMSIITIDKLESWFMPSMGQDALKGNFLEFENIVGEPIREAKRLGVPCPILKTMYGILRGIQARTKESKGLLKPEVTDAERYRG